MSTGACLHCGRVRYLEPRDLCRRCHRNKVVRHSYPTKDRGRASEHYGSRNPDDFVSAEEVERTVAEQMRVLPDWYLEIEAAKLAVEPVPSPPLAIVRLQEFRRWAKRR